MLYVADNHVSRSCACFIGGRYNTPVSSARKVNLGNERGAQQLVKETRARTVEGRTTTAIWQPLTKLRIVNSGNGFKLVRPHCPRPPFARSLPHPNGCKTVCLQPLRRPKLSTYDGVQGRAANSVVWRSSKATSTATRTTASGSECTRVAVASASTSGTGTKIKNSLQPPNHKAILFPVNKEVRASGLPIGWRIGGIALPFISTRLTSFLPQLHVR